MILRIKLLLLVPMFLYACSGSKDKDQIDFTSLPEAEKRLPENALTGMQIARELEVQLFASEPMITNPTNMSIDHLSRVWICEAYNYDVSPEQADLEGDRIVVLEDTDHDGKADKRTVFYQGTDINTPLGILVVGKKVYVSRSPNVIVFTDDNGDLVPDNKEILFTNLGRKGDHSAHSVFPGPDGLLYFSTGNMAGEISDKDGNAIKDRAGFIVNQKGQPYLGGMVMRFDINGENLEVLGHNFRNNYEPCIDSYGNVWQSDNDDDGYESCRINFVMPFGNYGYLDEKTRASWTTNRVGWENTIQERHWHQNDPGVVPNVLVTGAGSPAGMVYNEGDALTEKFANAPIHAEPYYNVVRVYLPAKAGAGYKAEIEDILKSKDQWFRPVDVSIAPDGSLFIADWYDPILGGGAAGDAQQGRIYRVAKKSNRYRVPQMSFSSVEQSIDALKNPNPETRFMAFHNLLNAGEKSITPLKSVWEKGNSLDRARALWILVRLERNDSFLKEALQDSDPMIRIVAIKSVLLAKQDPVLFLTPIANDPEKHVQRELITSLRYAHTAEAAALWSTMTNHYDGKDRWYLEALGIGSDLHADLFFETWLKTVELDLENENHQDIVWRTRARKAIPLLGELIRTTKDLDATLRYYRAFDFHTDPLKNEVLLTLMDLPREDRKQIAALALQQMDAASIKMTPALKNALRDALAETKGTLSFVDLVGKFNLRDQTKELAALAVQGAGEETGTAAIDQLIRFHGFSEMKAQLYQDDASALAVLKSMQGKGNPDILSLLAGLVKHANASLQVRQAAVQTLGSSWSGEEKLLLMVQEHDFPESLKPLSASILFNVYRSSIQREAAKILPSPSQKEGVVPSIKELVASTGNAQNGERIFATFCTSCHRVENEGFKFGPELTHIGNKLSKDGLYRAVLFPDEGISHGYASTLITLRDGSKAMGIITNETDHEVELSQPGGIVNRYTKAQIEKMEDSETSVMPNLAPAMSRQDLIDLVSYMETLKN